MKIEQALVLYLLKHKQISLQGIGTFKIDGPIPENTDNDKPFIIPPDSISFVYNSKTKEDDDVIDFIVQNTKKIKPLASADLDSFLTLGRQFLNIGKPFTIQNLGTLEKTKSGDLTFKPGPLIERAEVPRPKIEDAGAEPHEENLFNDYQKQAPNNGRTLLIIFIVIVLGAGGWAGWHFVFKDNQQTTTSNSSQSIVPIIDSTSDSVKVDTSAIANKIIDSLSRSAPQKNPADTFSFKVVVKETVSKDVAMATLQRLKNYGRKVIMYTDDDSLTYKIAHPFMLPLSDTARILDSLNKFYYQGKAYLEIK